MGKKIIGLDIDGVLVSGQDWLRANHRAKEARPSANSLFDLRLVAALTEFDLEAVRGVRQVLMAHPGTKIVVTSAWVGSLGMKETMAAMLRNGFTPDDFHTDWNLPLAARRLGYDGIWQKVADDPSYRASWPAMWLTLHPQVNRYVVLDDQWIGRQIVYHPKALHDPQLRKRRPWIVADDGWNGKPDGNWVHVAAQDGVDILRPRHVQQAIRILERIPDDAQHVSRFEQ